MGKLKKEKPLISKAGTKLTPEVIDELAAEAERGYDLSKWDRVVVIGRPSLGGGEGTSPRVSVRMSPEDYEAARQRAEREGRSISDLVREAVAKHLDS